MPPIFGRYQSGIEAATGNLVPAYGKMAEQTANSITGLGQNIAEGIKQYAKNRDEGEFYDAKAEALAGNVLQFQSIIADNPRLKGFNETLNPTLAQLQKFNTLSLSQKKGKISQLEHQISQIGNQFQMYNYNMDSMDKQNINKALMATPDTTEEINNLKSQVGVGNPRKSANQNLREVETKFDAQVLVNKEMAESKGMKYIPPEKSAFMKDWAKANIKMADSATDINEDVKNNFKAGLESYLAEQDMTEDEKLDPEALQNADIRNYSPTQLAIAGLPKEKLTPDSQGTVIEQRTKNAINQTAQIDINGAKAKLDLLLLKKQQVINGATPDELLGDITGKGTVVGRFLQDAFLGRFGLSPAKDEERQRVAELLKGYTPESGKKLIGVGDAFDRVLTTGKNSISEIEDFSKVQDPVRKQLENLEKSVRTDVKTITSDVAKLLQDKGDAGLATAVSKYDEAIKKQRAEIVKLEGGEPTQTPSLKGVVQPVESLRQKAEAELSKPITSALRPSVDFGQVILKKEIESAERKKSVAKYITEVLGASLPPDFNKFFAEASPENAFSIQNKNGMDFLVTADGKITHLPREKGMSPSEISKQKTYMYGGQDANGNSVPTELVEGSGIKLAGNIIAGTDKRADEIRTELTDAAEGIKLIRERLLPLYEKNAVYRGISPSEADRILPILVSLRAKSRKTVIGTGSQSNIELEALIKANPNPTALLNWIGDDKGKTEMVLAIMEDGMRATAEARGLKMIIDYPMSAQDTVGASAEEKFNNRNR